LTQIHLEVANEPSERQRFHEPARADAAHRKIDRFARRTIDDAARHVDDIDNLRRARLGALRIE